MQYILHGVGRLILLDFKDNSKVITQTDLQQFTLESTFSTDDVTGGNKMFPIASFKTDTALNFTAKNAKFDAGIIPYLDGGTVSKGKTTMKDVKIATIPSAKTISLGETAKKAVVEGFALVEVTPSKAGEFSFASGTLTFHEGDVGKEVAIVYEYETSEKAVSTSVKEKSMSKPFTAIYNFDIYDDDAQVAAKGSIIVYKAQSTSGLSLDMSHQTAYAPEFKFSARDAKREDGKLWDFIYDEVAA